MDGRAAMEPALQVMPGKWEPGPAQELGVVEALSEVRLRVAVRSLPALVATAVV
jgi:hypothetical protein